MSSGRWRPMRVKWGYKSALATPIRLHWAAASISMRRMSGRRRKSSAGIPTTVLAGTAGSSPGFSSSCGNWPGRRPNNRQSGVPGLLEMGVQTGHQGPGILQKRPGLLHVQLRHHPALKQPLGDLQGALLDGGVFFEQNHALFQGADDDIGAPPPRPAGKPWRCHSPPWWRAGWNPRTGWRGGSGPRNQAPSPRRSPPRNPRSCCRSAGCWPRSCWPGPCGPRPWPAAVGETTCRWRSPARPAPGKCAARLFAGQGFGPRLFQ